MRIRRITEAVVSTQDLITELSQYTELLEIGMLTADSHRETVRDVIASMLTEIANGLSTIREESDFPRFYSLTKSLLELKKISIDSEYSKTIGSIDKTEYYKPQRNKIMDATMKIPIFSFGWIDRPEIKELAIQYKPYTA